jgi:hypothetical protein
MAIGFACATTMELCLRAATAAEDEKGGTILSQQLPPSANRTEIALDSNTEGAAKSEVAENRAQSYFDEKQFLTALHLDPGRYLQLRGLDAPSVGIREAWISKSGTSGTSRLTEWSTQSAAFAVRHEDLFGLHLNLISLSSGSPSPETQIGSGGPRRFAPTTSLGLGVEPSILWSREGDLSPHVEIGSTPLNGIVGPTLQGRVGVTKRFGRAEVSADLFRQSITESILSYTGVVDPSSGRGFGRVIESGGELNLTAPIANRWNFETTAAAAIVTGVHVADNAHFSVEVSPSYALRVPRFDYFKVGPTYSFDTFNRNLSEFTFGQGGYFSPHTLHKFGLNANFLSAEGRDFMIRGSFFPGWEIEHEASAPEFPLNDNGERFPGSHSSGSSITGEAAAVYQLGSRWFLGGQLRFQRSAQFNELALGLSLKFSFDARRAVFSTDLPNPSLR